ncbi:hypothetical protein C8A05DRAFT_43162 [Staphylotrichum tortipilum]|uniref:NACHT domain-containing protein n=1 Tax=Staphylotrichum tortipilum TaxID=2831512 RepID=A0AAN6MMH3_9PEZI|nr:hypothetical protein C8A05DRAFT_43162 [Staphylotrichum longicolle]
MADPLSVAGLVIAIGGVIKSVVQYCSHVREAANEIRSLTTELLAELFALQGALAQLNSNTVPSTQSGPEFELVLRSADQALRSLAEYLTAGHNSKFGQSVQKLRWHWKKEEVQKHIQRIERAKVWFILLLTTDLHQYDQVILSQISQLNLGVQREWEDRRKEKISTENAVALQWLAPVDPGERYIKAIASHHPGTSQWFIDGPLSKLLESPAGQASILWLKGKSGSGKTTLLGHVLQYLQTRLPADVGFAYFFCSFDDLGTQDPTNILGSLLAQLATYLPGIVQEISASFKTQPISRVNQLTLVQEEEIFVRHGATLGVLFIVVDAVNESPRRNEITACLARLASQLGNLRIIVSSTGDPGFDLSPQSFRFLDVEMKPSVVDRDIQLYLQNALDMKDFFSPDLRREIKESISREAHGMFRYARWQAEHIMSRRTGRAAKKALTYMPQDLNETYCSTLGRLEKGSQDRELLRRALLWLAVAVRPLRLSELNEAVVVEDGDTHIDSDSRFDSPGLLIDIANGLLEYDPSSQTVSLGHSSIKAFLTSDWIKSSPASDVGFDDETAHKAVMNTCLTYLSFSRFRDGCTEVYDLMYEEYPLLGYAARSWPLHIKSLQQDDWTKVQSFLSTRSLLGAGNYGWWIELITGAGLDEDVVEDTHPLYYSSSFGYTGLVEAILRFDDTVDLEALGGRADSTALQVACFRRRLDVATLLVVAGANPLSLDGTLFEEGDVGFSSLWWAVENGWTELAVDMLASHHSLNHILAESKSSSILFVNS